MMTLLATLALGALAANTRPHGGQDGELPLAEVSIKAKAASGPAVQVPPPRPDRIVVDEVIRTLDLGRSAPLSEQAAKGTIKAASKRLSEPFPEAPFLTLSPKTIEAAYDGWSFEVLIEHEVVYKTEGPGEMREPLDWDGSGAADEIAARVDAPYSFRFVGRGDGAPIVLVSEPYALKSLRHRDYLGTTHLELSTSLLFQKGKAAFTLDAGPYLVALAERMRRANMGGAPYKFTLYDDQPRSELAKKRARAVARHFSKELLIAPERVQVEALTAGRRGRALVCVLPPEQGDTFGGGLQ